MSENEEKDLSATDGVIPDEQAQGQSDLERQLAEAQEEARTNLAGWQRSQADFANYQKREDSKKEELLDFAKEVTIVKILPTLDTLGQGLKSLPKIDDPEFTTKFEKWQTGIEATLQQLDKVLAEMGIQKIEAVGKQFDPTFHEAVREVEGEEDQKVVEELQTGFILNGKVIRPSQVVISKKN
ncbi:MAG: nucleotide exchange factor GrpE [Candidatus Doudnabacteria bacterium]